ncbi:amidase [Kribbella pratensis]|uniref:Amidase n=1 Tax=Kribbella pratensis TaxID=2512112 RepID=A0A4R8C8X3_9ACTN|nr:amidase [Kribbella pratensis]TDW69903.1 amidase [Kribbella pratensis]
MEWIFRTAEELLAALRAGEVSSAELTDEAIARIEREDKAINAICVPDFERARAAARDADEARARGEDRPLLGVPVTVKESYNVAGLPTTWGMPQHRDYVPAEDAEQVSRLKAAGAVVLGKTNVPLGLQDIQSFNELYGTTNNPWDHERTSGGSSGGSAAALASGFGALSIGSDLAGSLRTPAHFCGIYAHKPTLGLAATRGMVAPPAPPWPIDLDLAVVGPMARSARDLTLLLDVMAGPDPLTHGLAYDVKLPPARHERLSDFRVLVVDEHPLIPTGSAVRAGVNRVADALANGGARVERHTPLLPDLTEGALIYMQLLFSGSVARFPVDAYAELRTRAAALSPDDQSLDAAQLRAMVFSHRDWIETNNRREIHRQGWRELFAEFDVVVCPITPTPAFPHDHNPNPLERRIDIDGVDHPYFNQLVWAGVPTMPGLPATAIPTGPSPEGLPVGVQLIGPLFEDRTPLRLAELLEPKLGGFQPPR